MSATAISEAGVSKEGANGRVLLNTAKDHKGALRRPQRIGNHEKTARLTTFLCNFKIILFIFCYFVFFVNFGVSANYGGLRNDHSETPAHLSNEDSVISMVQQFSCAEAHKK